LPVKSAALLPILLAAVYGSPVAAASDSVRDTKPVVMPPVVVTETKTHMLFMGADIYVNLDRDLYPVRNVSGSSWVIDIKGQEKAVSAKEAPLNLKITPALKLTEVSAKITGFRRTPGYSFDNDPSVRLTRGLTQAGMTNAMLQGVAADAQHLADTVGNAALGPSAIFASGDRQFGEQALLFTAQTATAITHPPKAVPGSTTPPANPLVPSTFDNLDGVALAAKLDNSASEAAASQAANGNEPAGRLVTLGLDAMDVDFEISSATRLRKPYVVTFAKFHPANSKPGVVQNLVYARALDPIDSNPSHVHFVEDGFPFNYELIDFQVHIYDRGREIGTNIASNRVELTRDEAFQYVMMEYIGSHTKDTLPAEPAMGKLPSELPVRLAEGKYTETFYVRVSKDGLAREAFADAVCTKRIEDPFLESVVKSIRFKPALAEGKPVEGTAAVNLAQLDI
jgi:hypothetical protein